MPGAEAPVEVEVLAQEGRGDEARTVVHPALARELAHARVHDRVPGHALLPARERLRVVEVAVAARTQIVPRCLGVRVQERLVEIAPAELADVAGAALAVGCALHELPG